MNKKQLIARVQRHMGPGTTGNAAAATVEAVLSAIVACAAEEGKTHMPRFGVFRLKQAPAGAKLLFSPSRRFASELRQLSPAPPFRDRG